MNKQKTLNLLGLATRARKVAFGEGLVLDQMKHNKEHIIFLAQDAGSNITKKIYDKAKTYGITVCDSFTTEELSNAIGKTNRTVILVTDKGFSTTFNTYLNT